MPDEDQNHHEQEIANETPDKQKEPGPVPYARFKSVLDDLNALKMKDEKRAASDKKRQDEELAEQGKYKDLLAQRDQELAAERLRNTRQLVALSKGIPVELVDRLKGTTEAELTADADALLALLQKSSERKGPGVPPPSGGNPAQTVDLAKMTPQEIREWSEKNGWRKLIS